MKVDVALVGGGLANGLIAHRLRTLRPEVSLLVLERGDELGGNHTWSFHAGDVTAAQRAWLDPLVAHSWPSQEVRFPSVARTIRQGYSSVTSESFRSVLGETLGNSVRLGASVEEVLPHAVRLGDGTRVAAKAVIDGRGDIDRGHLELGFQKFVGRTLILESGHGLRGPILMDATVPQEDGFRFLYTLPVGDERVLVEDTRYSDTPGLAREEMRTGIADYVRGQGWQVSRTEGEEEGSLPIVLSGDIEAFWDASGPGVPRSGMRAGLFHPTTGYSLPEAVRLAEAVATSPDLSSPALYALTRRHAREAWRRGRFFRLLNRMLYRAAKPEERYRVLEHFYRLPEPLIARFYAGRLTWWDRARVLSGRPPVPIRRAVGAALGIAARPGGAAGASGGRS